MKRFALVAGVLGVVAVAVVVTVWLRKPDMPASKSKPAKGGRHELARGPIAHELALKAVFGQDSKDGRISLPNSRVGSVWAEQVFRIGDVERVAVLVAQESDGDECHACPADLGASVYRKSAGGWELESKAKEIGKVGGFGTAGSPEGLSAQVIGPGKVALLVPDSHTGQGVTESGVHILIYAPPKWINAGYAMLATDNSGQCSDDPKERKEQQLDACWEQKGTLTLTPGKNPEFYDVRIAYTGMMDGKPAANATLVFDGKTYEEHR